MIEILQIRIQTVNGSALTKQETVTNKHVFSSVEQMEQWRKGKELKLQYRATQRYLKTNPADLDHCPKVRIALTYIEK